jgi:hypothetical protein
MHESIQIAFHDHTIVDCCDIAGMGGFTHFEKRRARDGFIRWRNRTRREVSQVFRRRCVQEIQFSNEQKTAVLSLTSANTARFSGRFEIHDSNDR